MQNNMCNVIPGITKQEHKLCIYKNILHTHKCIEKYTKSYAQDSSQDYERELQGEVSSEGDFFLYILLHCLKFYEQECNVFLLH